MPFAQDAVETERGVAWRQAINPTANQLRRRPAHTSPHPLRPAIPRRRHTGAPRRPPYRVIFPVGCIKAGTARRRPELWRRPPTTASVLSVRRVQLQYRRLKCGAQQQMIHVHSSLYKPSSCTVSPPGAAPRVALISASR